MSGERRRCPACERQRRRDGDALCVDCWRAVPDGARRAHQALWREYNAGRATIKALLDSIKHIAGLAREAQFGKPLL